MADWPPVIALIITYERTNLAVATIKSVKERLDYPNVGFHIADDGSRPEHVQRLLQEIGPTYSVTTSNSKRAGVGANMNHGMAECLKRSDFILWLEDDWVIPGRLDLKPSVQLLQENAAIGMVRLGRLTAGIQGRCISGAGKLWWELAKGRETYTFSGNAALRHRRFCTAYGSYKEGMKPGETELWMCNQYNSLGGPTIVHPAWMSTEEMFMHTGDHQSFKWYTETGGLTAEQAAAKFAHMNGGVA